MCVYNYYSLYCTDCRKEFPEQAESARDLRGYAKDRGWKYIKVANGSYWDLCPTCFKDHRENNTK